MNAPETFTAATPVPTIEKQDPRSSMLLVTGRDSLVIKAGTTIGDQHFNAAEPVELPADGLTPGADYGIVVADGIPYALRAYRLPAGEGCVGGFHFAPGGNAPARAGGDDVPAINPCSLWDLNFRPACPDPRGMALVEANGERFWCDIYLTGVDHIRQGTSRCGAVIADGGHCPVDPATGTPFRRFDFAAANAIMAHHGKWLLTQREFEAAAAGVTEYSAHRADPEITNLDAPRTSRFGLMQATGNMWVWGRSNDVQPRASLFGGSWFSGGFAGSRYAYVVNWPGNSHDYLGARGRSDHLQLG
jgi:hypothetical protein